MSMAIVAAAFLALAFAGPASATSCIPIEMQLRELQPGTVVFVGTVTGRDLTAVQVRVDQWFAGDDPRDVVVIPIAGPGQPVIAGTWDPTPGQVWFIVGDRIGPESIESNVCRQMPVDVALVSAATSIFGSPKTPPFADPGTPPDDASSGLPLVIGAGVVVLGVLGGLGAVVALQRRGT